jgi:hypothetical protein
MVNAMLRELSPSFDAIHSPMGRPSVPAEHLLRAPVEGSIAQRSLIVKSLELVLAATV